MPSGSRAPYFVRREIHDRIEKRIEAFDKGYRQNIGIIAPEGLGKSQLLSSLFRSLRYQQRFLPVYFNANAIDFDHFAECWIGAMLSSVFAAQDLPLPDDFQSLLTNAQNLVPLTIDRIRQFKKVARREKGSYALKDLFSLVHVLAQETGKKVVLMLDEFQGLESLKVSDPFALLGKQIMVDKNVLYIAASSKPARAREIFKEKLTLLFGNFEVLEMKPFNFEESRDFLSSRLQGVRFTESQTRFLIRMTDGHPLYLEMIMDRLEMLLLKSQQPPEGIAADVPSETLLKAFHKELFDAKGRIALLFEKRIHELKHMGKDFSPYIRTLLALSDGRRRVLGIATYIEKKILETRNILQKLVQEDVVVRHGIFYTLDDPLFRFWLKYVYHAAGHCYMPEAPEPSQTLLDSLAQEFRRSEDEERRDITARVEALFKQFRNDVLEMGEKKIQCPQFSEIVFRPTNGRVFPLYARNSKVRWLCQIARETIREEDVTFFMEDARKHRQNLQRKILIALDGIDQNAKLLAQEARIQLWTLRDFNALLDLYDLPKMIPNSKEEDATALGALAQSIYTA